MRQWSILGFLLAALGAVACGPAGEPLSGISAVERARGPLRTNPLNPRYFTDGSGKALYLTGAHTWSNFQDWGTVNPPPAFDYPAYLAFLRRHSFNFFRLWTWEQASEVCWLSDRVWISPVAYERTGPGRALDGGLKFDVTRFNDSYFTRLRQRVRAAGEQGIYVSIMLFNGWSIVDKMPSLPMPSGRLKGNPWRGHPFHRSNNINGIDGDPDRCENGLALHTLREKRIVALEKAYVAKVIDTVGDLDNVLYEISNESDNQAREWQYEMINFIHVYERRRPKQHPVGMSVAFPAGRNADLWSSPADWIAPNSTTADPYKSEPPASSGRKVVVADTDHLWGVGGDPAWAWKSFLRGLNLLFMDPYKSYLVDGANATARDPRTDEESQDPKQRASWEAVRRALMETRVFAERVNLAAMTPRPDLASTGYCLAAPGAEYLVYAPRPRLRYRLFRNTVKIDLRGAPARMQAEWFNPASGEIFPPRPIAGGEIRQLTAPFRGEAVLHLFRF